MRATTLNSYLYKQYEDDDNLQALVAAYNGATQYFVTWLNEIGLPYYPGLEGDLLNWVLLGLYGLPKTQLASPLTPSQGPLNSLLPLNSLFPLNTFVAATQTFYNLSDDVLKRILTWNFYKGDGRKFSMLWLKRRIVRFLVGTNGVDPSPADPSFSIGTETRSAVGVVIASGACTVTIDQSLLSLQSPVITPSILTLFKLAFEGGNLELPLKYTYAVTIVVNFVALARPNVLASTSSAFNQTVGPSSVSTLGGSGIYTYTWIWQTGGAGITIDSPASISTTFSASGMSWGQTLTGIAACLVVDTVTSISITATCQVIISCVGPSQILIEGAVLPLLNEGGTLSVPIVVEP